MSLSSFTYWLTLIIFTIFSYGFIDLNLHLSRNPIFLTLQAPLSALVFQLRPVATGLFIGILLVLFLCYLLFLRNVTPWFASGKKLLYFLSLTSLLLVFAFPALSYDLFNYITTAKVAFTYKENPYVVMPVEIPNEPYLAFTRASNKLALYGPVWIAISAIPHYLGGGNIWRTIIAFKLMNAAAYLFMAYLIYRVTKSLKNVIFFTFNPLVLIETLVSGHNDIYMMILALAGLILWQKKDVKNKLVGGFFFFASWWIKGATVILLPLLFIKKLSQEKILLTTYYLLLTTFLVVAPLREELYPWYAVWLVSTASLLPLKRHPFLVGFTIVLTFALELRQMPYMWMGYYEGPGPLLRLLVTVVPVALYLLVYGVGKYLKKTA